MNKEANLTNKAVFEDYPIGKSLFIMSFPAIIGQLVTLIYNIADTFFIGQVNNPYMVAATSLVLPLFMMSAPISIVAGTGGGTLISRLLGIKEIDEARRVSVFSFYLSIVLASVYTLILIFFKDNILWLLGASVNNFEYARTYLKYILCIGAIPTIVSVTLANFLRSVGHSKEAGFGIALGGVLNIALDPLFMFVILEKGNEIAGAGIATMLSNVISCVYFIITIILLRDNTPLSFNPFLGLPEKKNIIKIFTVGLPSATTTLLFDTNNIVLNKLMSSYGDFPLAASGIVLKVERLSLNTNVGLCMGMAPIVAYNYSAKNFERMKAVIKRTRIVGTIIALVSLAIYEFFASQIMNAFIKNEMTVFYGTRFIKIRAIAALFMFLSFYIIHIFQGVGSGKATFWLAFMRYAMINIPLLFIFNHFFGMDGIMFGQFVGDVITSAISAIVLNNFLKRVY